MRPIRRILVSTFCLSPGLQSALHILFPEAEVIAHPGVKQKHIGEMNQALATVDAWINAEAPGYAKAGDFPDLAPRMTYVRAPMIEFKAFHPDACAAVRRQGDRDIGLKYNSIIGIWAYRHGLTPAEAASLFNARVFDSLGYFSRWDTSVERLRRLFNESSLKDDFERFYLRVKRLGNFMYSSTHPHSEVLATLGKLIAIKLGRDASVFDRAVRGHDGLTYYVWPVYPEIAQHYGIRSNGYVWRLGDGSRFEGIENFLTYCYRRYAENGFTPANIGAPDVDFGAVGMALAAAGISP